MPKVSHSLAHEASLKRPTYPPIALRPASAARALGISPRKLWEMTKAGLVPHARLGRSVSYPTAALIRWIEEQTISPIVRRPDADDAARGVEGKEVAR